ncbi:stalk domain-containing protein [Paenibacillus sp. FSL F4-0125]|uniref:stalk domain-containing protein n=1 Tax=Paenibacillus sp. FSL F4-0125 TaxID=2954730 RepID=UPI0030FA4EB1
MKKKVVTTLCGTMILLVGMGTGAFASSQLQEIKALLNGDLKIRVNGEITPLKDGNGKAVLPITYKGTTYLPVRSVSELLDVPVNYDGTAKEVIIGEQQAGVPVKQEDFNTSLYTKDPALTKYGSKNYNEVLYSAPNSNIKYTALSPNGKYQKLVLQFAAIGKEVESLEIRDNDKNMLLKKVEKISPNSDLQTIEVDISGVKNIAINVTQAVDGGFIIPLDTSIYK